jgi:uncharacterized membrane protein
MMGWNWGMGLLGTLGMLLFWAVFVGLLVWFILTLTRAANDRPQSTSSAVLETLRRRLAAGEITPQEFDELRHKLGV